jgi:phosphate transport system permease protein
MLDFMDLAKKWIARTHADGIHANDPATGQLRRLAQRHRRQRDDDLGRHIDRHPHWNIGRHLSGRRGWLAPLTRFINDVLLSAPSIVIGLFVYEIYVVRVKHFSGWAGALALSILVIPIVIRTTENMLRLVPSTLREAAAALGAPQWKVINFVTLRAARAGILTGVMLAVARISGETAPLLFTALNNQFWNNHMSQPMANLPVVIFQFAMSPYADWQQLAWAGALLITVSVLTLNILARVVFRQSATPH